MAKHLQSSGGRAEPGSCHNVTSYVEMALLVSAVGDGITIIERW